jgi:uncharacterized protein (TIGR03435 family)
LPVCGKVYIFNAKRFSNKSVAGSRDTHVNIRDLADALTLRMDRVVLDRTGVSGNFDIKTSPWSSIAGNGREPVCDANSSSLFAVLEEQLGFR